MKISFDEYDIKDIFKFLRESNNLSQKELAVKINKSIDWVKSVECGRINISLKNFLEITQLFKLEIVIQKKK